MLTKLEQVLDDRCIDGWTVNDDEGIVVVTAAARPAFSQRSDAINEAQRLLDDIVDLGYELRGGLVGAEMTIDDMPPWHARLLDLTLSPAPTGNPENS